MNAMDLLGALMQGGMSRSGGHRIEHSMGPRGMGGAGDILGQILGGAGGSATGFGSLMDVVGKLSGALAKGGARSAVSGNAAGNGGGLLAGLAGALFGGDGNSTRSAAGVGGMAVLGSLAMAALRSLGVGAGTAGTQTLAFDDSAKLMAGLRGPSNAAEEQQLRDVASLVVKAMINAAKADGRIDEAETDRIVNKLREGGISDEEQRFVAEEMRKPMDMESLVHAVPNQQVAMQVYAASLLAIEVDTDRERDYLQDLATALGLDSQAVAYLHSALDVTPLH